MYGTYSIKHHSSSIILHLFLAFTNNGYFHEPHACRAP
jgi:hypothetical protein